MNAKTLKRILRSLQGKSFKDFCGDKWTVMSVHPDGFQKDCDTGMDRWLLSLCVESEESDREIWDFPLSNQLKKILETEEVPIEFYELDYVNRYHWGIRAKHLGEQFLEKL